MNFKTTTRAGLPYGTVSGVSRLDHNTFFRIYVWQEDVAKIPKVAGAPVDNMVSIDGTIYSIGPIQLHFANFYAQNTFEK